MAVSLAEAETIRRIIHLRSDELKSQGLLLRLRYVYIYIYIYYNNDDRDNIVCLNV